MPSAHELLGFSAPTLQGGEFLLPLQVGEGVVTFRVAAPIMVQLGQALLFSAGKPQRPPHKPGRFASTWTTRLSDRSRRRYELVCRDYVAGRGSQLEICIAHGVNVHNWRQWMRRNRKAALAARS